MPNPEQENLNTPENNPQVTPERKEASDALKGTAENAQANKAEAPVVSEDFAKEAEELEEAEETIEKAYAPKVETENEKNLNEEEVEKEKDKIRAALRTLLTEHKDLESVPRYMLLRPFRTIAAGGFKEREKLVDTATDVIISFCKRVKTPYPKGSQEFQTLLEKIDSSEFDEKIKSAPAEKPQG